MKTLGDLYHNLRNQLAEHGIQAADQEARIILQRRLDISWAGLIAKGNDSIEETDISEIQQDLEQRLTSLSLGRLYGIGHFYGRDFELSESTLEPRNDTETLIDIALQRFPEPPPAILDLGTGTGCILITLLSEWPQAGGTGIDLSERALQTAKSNARRHHVESRAGFLCGFWADSLNAEFDLVVANPPYIESAIVPDLPEEVRNHDPILALDGGKDGLNAYKKIFSQLPQILKPTGRALFEIGYDQSQKVTRLAKDSGFSVIDVHPDRAGRPRVVELSLTS